MSDKQEQPVEQTKDIVVDDAAEGELIEHDGPMEDDPNDDSYDGGLIVVGVGASAGGLEALQDLVATIPPDIGVAFVVAQHLSPVHKSKFVEILSKHAQIPIVQAEDGAQLRVNEMVICPPGFNIEVIKGDRVTLSRKVDPRVSPVPSVDQLFESIATVKGERSIGVVLSGTGTDGTIGLRAIKAENGFGMVQDPRTAQYNGMPNSAIITANIDLVMKVEEIAAQIIAIVTPRNFKVAAGVELVPSEAYVEILKQLKSLSGVDFSLYKEKTLIRRIDRRMTSLRLKDAQEYCRYLSENTKEISLLMSDLLIGVTSFFRDKDAFLELRSELQKYIKDCEHQVLRIWTPGCSTGEEPYSIAMIIDDILGEDRDEWAVQIFATDIDPKAIAFAREGVYSSSVVKNVPEEYRRKYFVSKGSQYEVVRFIKSSVLFANHDLNRDPPFIRTDLISCRNLMIYFKPELQLRTFQVFHYSLNFNGMLFLGSSESLSSSLNNFKIVSKRHKIYKSLYADKKLPLDTIYKTKNDERIVGNKLAKPVFDSPRSMTRIESLVAGVDMFRKLIVEGLENTKILYPVIINESNDIVYIHGENPVLIRPVGVPTNNILKSVESELAIQIREVLHRLSAEDEWASTAYVALKDTDKPTYVRIFAKNAHCPLPIGRVVVLYFQLETEDSLPVRILEGSDGSNQALMEQKRILAQTEYQMQTLIEELETSNEEMQAMNEELQSSNEELQSSNEELETTNEELQATNEELQTAYGEIRAAYNQKLESQSTLETMKEALEESNSLLEESSRIGKYGSWSWDLETRRFKWSKGFCRIFGIEADKEDASYERFINIAIDDDRKRMENFISDLILGKTKKPMLIKALDSKERELDISVAAFTYLNDLGQTTKIIGIVMDISEKVSYQDESKLLKSRIDILLNNSFSGCYVLEVDTMKIVNANEIFRDTLGIKEEELDQYDEVKFFELFTKEAKDTFLEMIITQMNAALGTSLKIQYEMRTTDGRLLKVDARHSVFSRDGRNNKAKTILVNIMPVAGS
ncbi:hypothetical protein NCG89_10940 [Spongiibacter taiwanensis]|uniref:CheR family methyltransferase n=1 Tax=Spongiibacter taiwanensis TaxID=1748242 RepID=UPI0020363948|nr:CheR family methyltransferase [Spongiibacter taiwanensis]USA42037.1 hypothetical protein NCG89_10940 [Spongiibacter taiwanensis]